MQRLLPGESFAIVLTEEHTGRILRRASGLSAKTVNTILRLVDGAGALAGHVGEIVSAGRTLEQAVTSAGEVLQRAFGPLLEDKPRKLPARRKR
jgi:hypothetical protein